MTNKINLKRGKVEVEAILFKEGRYFIAFVPALNLTSHSTDEDKAMKLLNNAIKMFFTHWMSKRKLEEKLTDLGWKPSEEDNKYKPSNDNIQIPLSILSKDYSSRPLQIPAYC